EEQHVLALVAEIFGDGQTAQTDAGTRSWRLIHLAVHQCAFRTRDRTFLRILVDAGFNHLVIEDVAFARALTDSGEHRIAAVRLRDVVDQLHDQHGLAHAGPAEQADLAALGVRREQIHNLDARHENLRFGRLLHVTGSWLVDRTLLFGLDRTRFIDRLAPATYCVTAGLLRGSGGGALGVTLTA